MLAVVGFLWMRRGHGVGAEQAADQAKDVAAELESVFGPKSGRPTPGAVGAELFDPERVTVIWPDVPGVHRYGYTANDALGAKAATGKAGVELVYFGQARAPGWCFKVSYGSPDRRRSPSAAAPMGRVPSAPWAERLLHWSAVEPQARQCTDQVPQPADEATPAQAPGNAWSTSVAGMPMGVAAPREFTQIRTPFGASTRSTS